MRRLLSLIALVAAAAFGFGVGQRVPVTPMSSPTTPAPAPMPVVARGDLAADETATIDIFRSAQGSVAFISTAAQVRDPWRRRSIEMPQGSGSGFVWDAAGHIVTNAHVVRGASSASVRLPQGRAFDAQLVGVDPTHDLAVLKIDAPDTALRPLNLGESGNLEVGQKVFAIGNPFGLDFTLTTGIVSALDRELTEEGGIVVRGLVQTDAAINPGNSGGPLLDSAGRLIGVNTAIYSPSGASAGIGFAIPADVVNRVVPQLIARGRYDPPGIGIVADPRADALLRGEGRDGVLVLEVAPGSAAAGAGIVPAEMRRDGSLVPGDVVTALNATPVKGIEDLRAALERHEVGEDVTLTLVRQGSTREVRVTLERDG